MPASGVKTLEKTTKSKHGKNEVSNRRNRTPVLGHRPLAAGHQWTGALPIEW
jgi:hypothetical protein